MKRAILAVLAAVTLSIPPCSGAEKERKEIRVLYDFEDGAELKELNANKGENTTVELSADNGVTSGRTCCRVVGKEGGNYIVLNLLGEKLKGWENFDYFAMDVYTDRQEKIPIVFELWDEGSANVEYATRATFEDDPRNFTHPGANKLLWPINHAARNKRKEVEWREVEEKDRIKMSALTKVRIFFQSVKGGGDTVLWIDNLRLLQEDAVGGKIDVALPAGALAYDFGRKGMLTPGFTWIGKDGNDVSGKDVEEAGGAWPDTLTGDAIASLTGPLQFDVDVPDGEYCVWISAGKILNEKSRGLPFQLQVGDKVLCDETLPPQDFYGEKGIFRFMHTQYSQRPNALWLDYVEPAFPEQTLKVKAAGGKLTVKACNHRLAALIVVPAKEEAAFKKMAETLREQRMKSFFNALYFDKHDAPKKEPGDGAYVLWVPGMVKDLKDSGGDKSNSLKPILPWTAPTGKERKTTSIEIKAAIGQRAVARVCITPFEDLGRGDLEISDLKGPGAIPAANFRRYYQNYEVKGTSVEEQCLLPWTNIRFESGITWAYWLWLKVPDDAKPGTYSGTVTFKPEKGAAQTLPVTLEVYPFKLEDILPASLGMDYYLHTYPDGIDRRKMALEQLTFMREIGFTATTIEDGHVEGLKDDGHVTMSFDPLLWEVAKEVGMGRHPDQRCFSINVCLGFARQIGRMSGLKPDQHPGDEFNSPKLKGYYQDAIRQYKAFVDKMGLPFTPNVIDEPREMPNPWNRNMEQTIVYADWIKEVSNFTTQIPFTGDGSGDPFKDYTPICDHIDIVSVHAYESSKNMIAKAQSSGKILFFNNTGMDRLSWGFYPWRMNCKGRDEWHWLFSQTGSGEGYPNPAECYTPFLSYEGWVRPAPYWSYAGGFAFKSAFLDVNQGITDFAYLITLEEALEAAKSDSSKAKTVDEARNFLAAIKKAIPTLPKVKGLADASAGALVGAGLDTPVAELCETWRRQIAGYLSLLKN